MRRELGKQAYEVLFIEPWDGPLPDPLTGQMPEEVERRLRTIAAEAVRPPPPTEVRRPKSWAKPARRQEAVEGDDLEEESAVVDAPVMDADLLVAEDEVGRQPGGSDAGLAR